MKNSRVIKIGRTELSKENLLSLIEILDEQWTTDKYVIGSNIGLFINGSNIDYQVMNDDGDIKLLSIEL